MSCLLITLSFALGSWNIFAQPVGTFGLSPIDDHLLCVGAPPASSQIGASLLQSASKAQTFFDTDALVFEVPSRSRQPLLPTLSLLIENGTKEEVAKLLNKTVQEVRGVENTTEAEVADILNRTVVEAEGVENATTELLNSTVKEVEGIVANVSEVVEDEGEVVENATKTVVSNVTGLIEKHPFWDGVTESFVVVALSEAFDRSWIACILCVMQYGKSIAFVGSLAALLAQVGITACAGMLGRELFSYMLLHVATAAVLGFFSFHSAFMYYHTDPDTLALRARRQAEKGGLVEDPEDKAGFFGCPFAIPGREIVSAFLLVFRAEWGDQTQFAMLSLQSSGNVPAVCLGASLAFVVLTGSALAVGSIIEPEQLRERIVHGVSAVMFATFALVSLWNSAHPP